MNICMTWLVVFHWWCAKTEQCLNRNRHINTLRTEDARSERDVVYAWLSFPASGVLSQSDGTPGVSLPLNWLTLPARVADLRMEPGFIRQQTEAGHTVGKERAITGWLLPEISATESIKMNHSSNEKDPETIEPLRYLRYAVFFYFIFFIKHHNVTKLNIDPFKADLCWNASQ